MAKIAFIVMLCVGLIVGGATAKADATAVKVIVNAQTNVTQLKKSDVRAMYLKKVTRWKDDTLVTPLDLPSSSPTREAFTENVLGTSKALLTTQWQQRIFSGLGVPPKLVADDATMLSIVGSTRGAIGYVRVDAPVSAAVTVVTITD